MGATVVSGNLSSAYWAKSKPADYKGQDLDRALKSYEGLAGKSITIPSSLIPSVPKSSIKEVEKCITQLQAAVTELQKGVGILKQTVGALKAIQGAAAKAAGELRKQADGAGANKQAYQNAAGVAEAIGGGAGNALKTIE